MKSLIIAMLGVSLAGSAALAQPAYHHQTKVVHRTVVVHDNRPVHRAWHPAHRTNRHVVKRTVVHTPHGARVRTIEKTTHVDSH